MDSFLNMSHPYCIFETPFKSPILYLYLYTHYCTELRPLLFSHAKTDVTEKVLITSYYNRNGSVRRAAYRIFNHYRHHSGLNPIIGQEKVSLLFRL
jgi:hypothetical protein